MAYNHPAILQDDLLKLRAPEPADIELLMDWENNPQNWYFGDTLAPFSRHAIESYILNFEPDIYKSGQLRFMIEMQESAETVGTIDLYDFSAHHRRAGVGILIGRSEQRDKGLAKKALQKVQKYAFDFLELHQLYAGIAQDNEASKRLFRSCGFEQTGLRRDWLRRNGKFVDQLFLQCVAPSWRDI